MLATPARKAKNALTLIPEEERPIAHRFNFALVGDGAHAFAEMAIESDMAEAFAPKGMSKAPRKEDEGTKKEDEDKVPLVESQGSPTSTTAGVEEHDLLVDELVLFLPTGAKEITRVRFQPVEKFGDSLPLTGDLSNQGIVFLFWKVGKESDEREAPTTKTPTEEIIGDWFSRMAEINYVQARLKPYTTILAFEADEDQSRQLQEFASKQKLTEVSLQCLPDDSEGTVMDALQSVTDNMIAHAQLQRTITRGVETLDSPRGSTSKRSPCCVIA